MKKSIAAQRHGESPLPWRQGRSVGRTIYDADDILIGVMDKVEDAALVVFMVNKSEQLREQEK